MPPNKSTLTNPRASSRRGGGVRRVSPPRLNGSDVLDHLLSGSTLNSDRTKRRPTSLGLLIDIIFSERCNPIKNASQI